MVQFIAEIDQKGKKFDTADDIQELLSKLHDYSNDFETLKLEGNSYGIQPLKEIGDVLQICHNLRHLLLNDIFTSRLKNEIPVALKYLFHGIMSSEARIITLNLSDNAIGPVTMPELLPFLQSESCSNLKYLYLNNCGLGIKGGTILSTVLSKLINLQELVIGRNRLEIDGILEISTALSRLNKLERLELPQNGTKEKAIISLCYALEVNPSLKILNLNDNVLSTTYNSLANSLKYLTKLEKLNLGDCLLKTQGCIAIMAALRSIYNEKPTQLSEIILNGNEIGKDAENIIISTIKTILETRENSSKKLIIDLSSNNLGEECVHNLKNSFGSIVELIIEDDQGSDNEEESENDFNQTNEDFEKDDQNLSIVKEKIEDFINDQEKLSAFIESNYTSLESLCHRFFTIAIKGFQKSDFTLKEQTIIEIDALMKYAQKSFVKNESDFSLVNVLLVTCGLIKGENKTVSPSKDIDLSGPILALARLFQKEFNLSSLQKKCMKQFITTKLNEDRYKELKINVLSKIYSF